jgi:hypothetical protein
LEAIVMSEYHASVVDTVGKGPTNDGSQCVFVGHLRQVIPPASYMYVHSALMCGRTLNYN